MFEYYRCTHKRANHMAYYRGVAEFLERNLGADNQLEAKSKYSQISGDGFSCIPGDVIRRIFAIHPE